MQESIYERLIDKLKRRLQTLRVGDPLDKNTDVGAINSQAQLEKIQELVASGEEEGAEIYQPPLPPARRRATGSCRRSSPNVAQSYRIAQEEIFGPVLSVLTFRTPDEAVEKANNTPYGLSAGVWTEKGSRILSMAQRLRAGVIWANTYNRFDPTSPFGGYKESGFGREGGLHGLEPVPGLRMSRLPVRKTYKLFIGGEFPRSESGRTYEAEGAERRPRLAEGRARLGARRARCVPEVGRRDRLQPRPGALPRRGDDGGAPLRVRRPLLRAQGGRALDRPLRLVRRLGRQARAGDRLVESGRRAVLQLHGAGADGRGRDPRAAGAGAAGLVSRVAPALVGGNAVVVVASEPHPLAAVELAEALATADVPGGVVNILTGSPRGARAGARVAHGRERARRLRRRRGGGRARASSRPTTSSASSAAPPTIRAPGRSQPSSS